jgi:hypothetical protein
MVSTRKELALTVNDFLVRFPWAESEEEGGMWGGDAKKNLALKDT